MKQSILNSYMISFYPHKQSHIQIIKSLNCKYFKRALWDIFNLTQLINYIFICTYKQSIK